MCIGLIEVRVFLIKTRVLVLTSVQCVGETRSYRSSLITLFIITSVEFPNDPPNLLDYVCLS